MHKPILICLSLVALLLSVTTALLGKRVTLVALADTRVAEYPHPNLSDKKNERLLASGERVKVIGCDDLKSYPAIHIIDKDGRDGYVIDATYQLEYKPIWSDTESPVSFSCAP